MNKQFNKSLFGTFIACSKSPLDLGGLLVGFLLFFYVGCKEEERFFYFDKDAPTPAMVDKSSVVVEDYAGYSVIRFRSPDDNNLMCVRAEYESAPGVVRETKASRYTDTLTVEGFGVAGDHLVKLYSVGKNSKESNPVEISVSPLTPPVLEAYSSLDLLRTFGGVKGSFYNAHGVYLTAVLMADTAHNGTPEWLQSFVIKDYNANFSYFGLDSVSTDFSIYLQDRWGNKTEPKNYTLKPLFEEELDKDQWKRYTLPSDFLDPSENNPTNYAFERAWDGISSWGDGNIFASTLTHLPWTGTIDLGQTVIISRLKLFERTSYEYKNDTMKVFECWGSNESEPDDDLDGGDWTLLGKFRSRKPSGDGPVVTQEDKEFGNAGENYIFDSTDDVPDPYIPIRYFRFRVFENWSGAVASDATTVIIPEMTLFGQIVKK